MNNHITYLNQLLLTPTITHEERFQIRNTLAIADAIRGMAPKPVEIKTGMTFPPGFASELSAAVMALRGNHTQDAAGDDLVASQPKPGQEDRDEADEQSRDSEACLTCGHSRMGGITLTATDYYALVQRAEKAEAERDAILNALRALRNLVWQPGTRTALTEIIADHTPED